MAKELCRELNSRTKLHCFLFLDSPQQPTLKRLCAPSFLLKETERDLQRPRNSLHHQHHQRSPVGRRERERERINFLSPLILVVVEAHQMARWPDGQTNGYKKKEHSITYLSVLYLVLYLVCPVLFLQILEFRLFLSFPFLLQSIEYRE